jgi:hypothetical protein
MAVKIQFRRDTAANWTAVSSTVLSAGEVGYESDTGNIKIGDGTTQWQNLAYYQLPNVSVNPATSSDLNATNYRVMGRYRLDTVTSGTTLTNGPSDLDAADADSVCTLLVTTHAYDSLTTHVQQTLTQFSASATSLKQWVRLYNGTNWTAWTSTAHLSDGEVTTAKIADANVTTAKIADTNVTTAKIADDAVTADKLADDASTDGNRAVTTNHIRNSAVTTAKIADSNVTTAKIADSNVTFAKLPNSAAAGLSVIGRSANSAGVFAEIAAGTDGQVLRRSGTAVGFGTIATAGIADSAVTTAKILDANVTVAKVAADIMQRTTNQIGVFVIARSQGNSDTVTQTVSGAFINTVSGASRALRPAAGTWTVMFVGPTSSQLVEQGLIVGMTSSSTDLRQNNDSASLVVIAIRTA